MTSTAESQQTIEKVVKEVSRIVSEMAGIQLGPKQFSMVENRLRSRMVKVSCETFQGYLDYLQQHKEGESQALLSLMTTHHTYFFREFSHFEFLIQTGLDHLIAKVRERPDKTLKVWSAACSRGQEVYSLAMFLEVHLKQKAPDLKYEVWGSDVDPDSVEIAKNGVYRNEELKQVPVLYSSNHWTRGKGAVAEFSKAKASIRNSCHFEKVNLLSPESFLSQKKFDLIFCRNVFIYFNLQQMAAITKSFLQHLQPWGYLVLGVSETLNGLGLPVHLIGASVYQHEAAKKSEPTQTKVVEAPAPKKTYEILCVDDSTTIHALMSKILTKDHDFHIKAKAKNGREALELLQKEHFDAITLDLHMPEMDGVTFLQNYKKRDIPILVVSSVDREKSSEGQKALALGAFDYVEKPSLENLAQAGNEIRSKLKIGLQKLAPQVKVATTPKAPPPTTPVRTPSASPQPAKASAVKTVTASVEKKKIRVLVVDDSETIRNLLAKILAADSEFEIVGLIGDPLKVEAEIVKSKPDLITLDIHMPGMDGVTLLKKIHPKYAIPAVMISSISQEEGPAVLDALSSGAIDYIQKPKLSDLTELAPLIRERLKTAAQARVQKPKVSIRRAHASVKMQTDSLILMGASTGGTEALRVVLQSLPNEIPPILIVQHIPPVFSKSFADRLNSLCPFEVKEAENGDEVIPNRVLIAPGGTQMKAIEKGGKLVVEVNNDAPVNRHKPSVDYLFENFNQASVRNLIAVILTGMGADGARGMKVLRDKGCRTIAQDQASCVVFGMPREAIERGGAEFVLPLDRIADQIVTLNTQPKSKKVA